MLTRTKADVQGAATVPLEKRSSRTTAKRVLIIGGTGVFGKRLVRHLSHTSGIEVIASSRSLAKAEHFLGSLPGSAVPLHPVALDHSANLLTRLAEIKPDVVIDCSGPFQGASYDTARAVLDAGAHLIDLADARDYLAGFAEALDDLAKARGVTALTGASSTPTLSTCVVDHLTQGWQQVDGIDICITPGGKSEVGASVIKAILSYAGREISVWEGGQTAPAIGWTQARHVDIPGLGRRRVALVETFDAEHLGQRLNVASHVRFCAGLESRLEQRGIEAIAALRARGWVGRIDGLIPTLLTARKLTRIPTSDSGGMMVSVSGRNAGGAQCKAEWVLIARQDHGPYVPVLPAAAALKMLLSGGVDAGAQIACDAMALADIENEMTAYPIATNVAFAAET